LRKDGEIEALLHRIWYDSHVGGGLSAKLLTDVVGADRIVFGTNFAGWDAPADEHHEPIPAAYADNARRLLRHKS
jgi:aminocarboxymuconate-semialdehyde decarboxylase